MKYMKLLSFPTIVLQIIKKKQLLIKRNINVIPYNFHFYFLSYFYAAVPKGKNSIHRFVNYRFIGCPSRYERRRTYHCNRI